MEGCLFCEDRSPPTRVVAVRARYFLAELFARSIIVVFEALYGVGDVDVLITAQRFFEIAQALAEAAAHIRDRGLS